MIKSINIKSSILLLLLLLLLLKVLTNDNFKCLAFVNNLTGPWFEIS
jgi:hypothetical protein